MNVSRSKLPHPRAIVAFWRAAGRARWFARDAGFDRLCRTRFLPSYAAAQSGALDDWLDEALGALALLVLLDQLSRNMFRGTPRVYAADAQAQAIADAAIAAGYDRRIGKPMRQIFYLPFMHAEDRASQARSLALYGAYGEDTALRFARHHAAIVERFGRFPHRNAILGRTTSVAEAAFLKEDPFRG